MLKQQSLRTPTFQSNSVQHGGTDLEHVRSSFYL